MKKIFSLLVLLQLSFGCFAQKAHQLSSHILDISTGYPAPAVSVTLEKMNNDKSWTTISTHKTDLNGRVNELLPYGNTKNEGIYKLVFDTYPYFKAKKTESFYPFTEVVFIIKDQEHLHVAITISPFGYSTYKGS